MKCHWSAHAEIAVGIPLLATGIILLTTKQKEVKISMGIMGVVLGVVAALIPSYMIGVCGMGTMICRQVMLPAILLASGLVVLAGVAIVIIASTRKEIVEIS